MAACQARTGCGTRLLRGKKSSLRQESELREDRREPGGASQSCGRSVELLSLLAGIPHGVGRRKKRL